MKGQCFYKIQRKTEKREAQERTAERRQSYMDLDFTHWFKQKNTTQENVSAVENNTCFIAMLEI